MWIVAVGWGYVVILMAATETSIIAGIMTLFGYGVLPLSLLFYVTGGGRRRARREAQAARRLAQEPAPGAEAAETLAPSPASQADTRRPPAA